MAEISIYENEKTDELIFWKNSSKIYRM